MIVNVSGAVPVLLRTKVCAADAVPTWMLPKAKLDGVSDTEAAPPVPVTVNVCGDPAALVACETMAERLPAAVGVNFMLIEQLAPCARVLGALHVPVPPKVKSPGLLPVIVAPAVRLSAADPLLVIVDT